MAFHQNDPLARLGLPPGFRFYPTDEELMVQYLCKKVAGHPISLPIIGEIDMYKFDPWVLPSKAMFGEKEWYFFSSRDRKYPNGSRPNRVAGTGYWKATGTDKIITTEGRKVGIKKALVFYVGKAPKGTKTNWIMHEYRLFESSGGTGSSKLDDWVLCRIYEKTTGAQKPGGSASDDLFISASSSSSSSQNRFDDVLNALPPLESPYSSISRMAPGHGIVGNGDDHRPAGMSSVPALRGSAALTAEEEVQSGLRSQGVDQWGYSSSQMGEPFLYGYPTQHENQNQYWFRQ